MKGPKGSFFYIWFLNQLPTYMKYLSVLIALMLLHACTTAPKNPVVDTVARDTVQTDTVIVFQDRDVTNKSTLPVQNTISAIDSIARVKKNFPFVLKNKFEAYTVPLYKGTPAAPDFRNNPYANDPEYVEFITKGCIKGINFGGYYTLIEGSCGAMCSHLYMVDRRDGKIFIDTKGLKEEDGYYGFAYKKDSNLLITDAAILTFLSGAQNEFSITPQVFEWKNDSFVLQE